MMFLPPEIIEKVFDNLDASTLNNVMSNVSLQWGDIVSSVLEKRIGIMLDHFSSNSQHLSDIRNQLVPEKQEDNQCLLEIYEKAFLSKGFGIEKKHLGEGALNFVAEIRNMRGCDCHRQNLCIIRSLYAMPCHQLILVQTPEKIEFYHMTCFQFGKECRRSRYKTSVVGSTIVTNVWIDNNTHTAVSVFNNKIVCQETTRALILFRVKQVNHSDNTVVLENIRRIFLPLWSCDLLLLENMVCSLFTTGNVGIWRMEENDIQVSENLCADAMTMRNMRLSKMYLCNALVIIKIVTEGSSHWSVFDSTNTIIFQVQSVDLNTFIKNIFLNSSDTCSEVFDIYVAFNVFIVHCQVITSLIPDENRRHNKRPKTPAPTYREIACRRMTTNLCLEHFQSLEQFNLCFDDECAKQLLTDPSEYIAAPFLSLFINSTTPCGPNDIVSFIGVNDFPVYRSDTSDSAPGKIVAFHVLLYSLKNK